MTVSISHPTDPVTNGASEIQSTNFVMVAADYEKTDWASVQRYMKDKKGYGNGPVDSFPYGDTPDFSWSFAIRKDLSAANATLRDVIGWQTSQKGANLEGVTADGKGTWPVLRYKQLVNVWFPVQITLTSGTILTWWLVTKAEMPIVVDPETRALLLSGDNHRMLYAAVNSLVKPVAAGVPIYNPATRAISGALPFD